MNEDQVRQIIREELSALIYSDRYFFQKNLQLGDGRTVQLGRTTGTKIGTGTDQKLAFFNATPVVQQATVTAPNTQGGTYNQSDVQSIVTAVNSVITRLRTFGLIA